MASINGSSNNNVGTGTVAEEIQSYISKIFAYLQKVLKEHEQDKQTSAEETIDTKIQRYVDISKEISELSEDFAFNAYQKHISGISIASINVNRLDGDDKKLKEIVRFMIKRKVDICGLSETNYRGQFHGKRELENTPFFLHSMGEKKNNECEIEPTYACHRGVAFLLSERAEKSLAVEIKGTSSKTMLAQFKVKNTKLFQNESISIVQVYLPRDDDLKKKAAKLYINLVQEALEVQKEQIKAKATKTFFHELKNLLTNSVQTEKNMNPTTAVNIEMSTLLGELTKQITGLSQSADIGTVKKCIGNVKKLRKSISESKATQRSLEDAENLLKLESALQAYTDDQGFAVDKRLLRESRPGATLRAEDSNLKKDFDAKIGGYIKELKEKYQEIVKYPSNFETLKELHKEESSKPLKACCDLQDEIFRLLTRKGDELPPITDELKGCPQGLENLEKQLKTLKHNLDIDWLAEPNRSHCVIMGDFNYRNKELLQYSSEMKLAFGYTSKKQSETDPKYLDAVYSRGNLEVKESPKYLQRQFSFVDHAEKQQLQFRLLNLEFCEQNQNDDRKCDSEHYSEDEGE